MTAVGPDVVSRIAALAALELPPADTDRVAAELGSIVAWVDALADLPAEPAASDIAAPLPLRADRVTSPERGADLLAVAPELDGERFRVPAVLER